MGDRITMYRDCPKCGGKGTFECYEALSSNMKMDECEKCGYTVNYDFEETDDGVLITKVAPQDQTQADELNRLWDTFHPFDKEKTLQLWGELIDQYAQQRALELLNELEKNRRMYLKRIQSLIKPTEYEWGVPIETIQAKRLNLTKEKE